jgi:hypothetical protein
MPGPVLDPCTALLLSGDCQPALGRLYGGGCLKPSHLHLDAHLAAFNTHASAAQQQPRSFPTAARLSVSGSHSLACGDDGDDRVSDRRSVVFRIGVPHASQLKTAVVPEAFFHVSEVRRQSGGTRGAQQVSRLLERQLPASRVCSVLSIVPPQITQ